MVKKTKNNEKGFADSELAQKDTAPQNGTQNEAKPKPQYPFEIDQCICYEVWELMTELEDEIKLLQQSCDNLWWYYFKKEVPDLLELRNRLEETRNHLSRQNYSLSWGSKLHKTLYGEDEFK
jgi:tryptophanyl-tRNA synthetase